jgi:hypothetical protein
MRLTFAKESDERIRLGIAKLASVYAERSEASMEAQR